MKVSVTEKLQPKRVSTNAKVAAGVSKKAPSHRAALTATSNGKPAYQTLSNLSVTVKTNIEAALRLPNGLLIAGWVFDPDELVRNFCVFDKNTNTTTHVFDECSGSHLYRLYRPDVSSAQSGVFSRGDDHGFLAYVAIGSAEAPLFALALKSGVLAVVDHPIDRTAQEAAAHLRPGLSILVDSLRKMATEIPEVAEFVADHLVLPELSDQEQTDAHEDAAADPGKTARTKITDPGGVAPAIHLSGSAGGVKVNVELALDISSGLLVIGWIWDPKHMLKDWGLGSGEGQPVYRSTAPRKQGVFYRQTLRPDVGTSHGGDSGEEDWCGFVVYVSKSGKEINSLVVRTKSAESIVLPLEVSTDLWGNWGKLESIWTHSGAALRQMALTVLPEKHAMREWLDDFAASQWSTHGSLPLVVVEKSGVTEGSILLLQGWISLLPADIESLELWHGAEHQDLLPSLIKSPRPDLIAKLSLGPEARPGYVSLSPVSNDWQGSCRVKLKARDGRMQIVVLRVTPIAPHVLIGTLVETWDDTDIIQAQIALIEQGSDVAKRMPHLYEQAFKMRYGEPKTFAENPLLGMAAVDRSFPLNEGGLLVFGWQFSWHDKPRAIYVRSPQGDRIKIDSRMYALSRIDVRQTFAARFPDMPEASGFVVHVPLPTSPGALRMLEFDFGEAGKIWKKIPTDNPVNGGVALVKEILQWIPAPERIGPRLGTLLGECIGPAVERVVAAGNVLNTALPMQRQFGALPAKPVASVVVPLYGRYDFLRHQVAHFVDDPDFQNIDLIYVVDDPNIEQETLALAARVHALFGVPFRVVSYGHNRGFGGANNIGAACATAPLLVFLNSDVMPIAPGWVSGLAAALNTLPSASMVAPLLLYHDGMVQHAGMTSGVSADIDGLLVNRHPGKGLPWAGGEAARTVELLTAACFMMRTEDFRTVGGFDESFIVGDYEDSDLCRRLAGKDGLLYLLPQFKLWHLERQSQAIGATISQRMLITIMNGMRYSKRYAAQKEA